MSSSVTWSLTQVVVQQRQQPALALGVVGGRGRRARARAASAGAVGAVGGGEQLLERRVAGLDGKLRHRERRLALDDLHRVREALPVTAVRRMSWRAMTSCSASTKSSSRAPSSKATTKRER
jgi:hypothetical protein